MSLTNDLIVVHVIGPSISTEGMIVAVVLMSSSISYRSRPQSSFWYRDLFLPIVPRHLIFWPIGQCIILCPIQTCPRVGA
jgi:hypothetical protein